MINLNRGNSHNLVGHLYSIIKSSYLLIKKNHYDSIMFCGIDLRNKLGVNDSYRQSKETKIKNINKPSEQESSLLTLSQLNIHEHACCIAFIEPSLSLAVEQYS